MKMKEGYDFSKAVKNPYAKRLKKQLASMSRRNNRLAIGMSCTNCGNGIEASQLYRFVAAQSGSYEAYALRPRAGIHAAAIDVYLVLGTVGSVASIASVLWMAYDKFIAHKKGAGEDAGIYLVIPGPDEDVVHILLGKDVETQDEFKRQFQLMVQKARDAKFDLVQANKVEEIESSGTWIKIDKANGE